jgi:hypothetical protein
MTQNRNGRKIISEALFAENSIVSPLSHEQSKSQAEGDPKKDS